jgi:hypothetical protein
VDYQKLAPAWEAESWRDRVQRARMLLFLHEFITDAENERAKRRMDKAGAGPEGIAESHVKLFRSLSPD